jgi:F-type H+-transporting ATPase subunit b
MPQGLERIGVHLPSLLAYVVNFAILLVLLHLVAYRPFLRRLAERTGRIQQGLADAEAAAQLREEAMRERETALAGARDEARQMVEAAAVRAQAAVEQGRLKGQEEAALYLQRMRQRMETERRQALDEVGRTCRDLVFLAAEKALGRVIDRQVHQETVEAALREVAQEGQLRQVSWRLGRVITAMPLTAEEVARIQDTVAKAAGRPVTLHPSTDPQLLGGVLLSLDDTVVDATVAGRLQQLYGQIQV